MIKKTLVLLVLLVLRSWYCGPPGPLVPCSSADLALWLSGQLHSQCRDKNDYGCVGNQIDCSKGLGPLGPLGGGGEVGGKLWENFIWWWNILVPLGGWELARKTSWNLGGLKTLQFFQSVSDVSCVHLHVRCSHNIRAHTRTSFRSHAVSDFVFRDCDYFLVLQDVIDSVFGICNIVPVSTVGKILGITQKDQFLDHVGCFSREIMADS